MVKIIDSFYYNIMKNERKQVRSTELPICPFCDGKIYYENWITHKIFHIECEKCKAHWRTGIKNNEERDIFLELLKSENPEISNEYINKRLSLNFWRDLLRNKIKETL
ncbi:MAG: hypothetical protein KAJ21_03430 [Thermoplasmatales archaeon]|nr:hypothetical protein [Thermoplasmatales archaeon]